MRIDRRGSVTVEGVMVLPIAVVVIVLGQYLLEASLHRQETAVSARSSTVEAAAARRVPTSGCSTETADFSDRASVEQTENVERCRRNGERGLSRERPVWDALERAADPWDEILRDVRPRRGPSDIVGAATTDMTFDGPAFLENEDPVDARQRFIWPEAVAWTHEDDGFEEGHDAVIWDELCKSETWKLFPAVFPSEGPRC